LNFIDIHETNYLDKKDKTMHFGLSFFDDRIHVKMK